MQTPTASHALRLACALMLWGCGSRTTFVGTARPPVYQRRLDPAAVDVYTASRPTRPFREVGIIETRQASDLSVHDSDDVIREMRAAAAARGCDGLIITGSADEVTGSPGTRTTTTSTGPVVAGTTFSRTTTSYTPGTIKTLKGFRGTCIAYTRPRPTPAANVQASADPGISRLWRGGRWELSMLIRGTDLSLMLRAAIDAGERTQLELRVRRKIESSTQRSEPKLAACELELVVASESALAEERRFSATMTQESIDAVLPTAALERAAVADAATLKLCETEIALNETTRKRLGKFARRLREERAKSAPAPQSDGTRLEL